MSSESSTSPPTIRAGDLTSQLSGDGIPEGYICFKGYLQSASARTHRLYVDTQFLRWLEVDREDIAARIENADNPADPRDQIWVRRSARVAKCEACAAPDAANEGWGVDTDPIVGPRGIELAGRPEGRGKSSRFQRPDLPARVPPPY